MYFNELKFQCFHICLLLFTAFCLPAMSVTTCEETETARVKLDLAKQSISSAKFLYPKCNEGKTNDSDCSVKDRSLAHLNAALDLISEAKMMCHSCQETKVIVPQSKPIDCTEIKSMRFNKSGVYKVWPRGRSINSNESLDVFCDMETDGGGWTVIQRRGKYANQTDFNQDWEAYKRGFGDIQQEFWLGNENILSFTNQGNYSVRFDLVDVKGEYRYATYNSFSIGDEDSGYVLRIQNHTGNATDDMTLDHGAKFSTKDRQNDGRGSANSCSNMYHSAFWFSSGCGYVNLNGIYQPGVKGNKSIWWFQWKDKECLSSVEIKIRRKMV